MNLSNEEKQFWMNVVIASLSSARGGGEAIDAADFFVKELRKRLPDGEEDIEDPMVAKYIEVCPQLSTQAPQIMKLAHDLHKVLPSQKIEAIKRLRLATGIGLLEAKRAMDLFDVTGKPEYQPTTLGDIFMEPFVVKFTHLCPELVDEAPQIMKKAFELNQEMPARKIQAIKDLRATTGIGLREAKTALDIVRGEPVVI